jgi:hypothetical protein
MLYKIAKSSICCIFFDCSSYLLFLVAEIQSLSRKAFDYHHFDNSRFRVDMNTWVCAKIFN